MVTDWTNDSFVGTIQGVVSDGLGNAGVADWLVSLVSDGIIGGLGAVAWIRSADGNPVPVPFHP